jgi:hypothetical protein
VLQKSAETGFNINKLQKLPILIQALAIDLIDFQTDIYYILKLPISLSFKIVLINIVTPKLFSQK